MGAIVLGVDGRVEEVPPMPFLPEDLPAVARIETMAADGIALCCDETIQIWRRTTEGPAWRGPPADLSGVVDVAGCWVPTSAQVFAVRADGTVVSWGMEPAPIPLPDHLGEIVAVTTSWDRMYFLRRDGRLLRFRREGALPLPDNLPI